MKTLLVVSSVVLASVVAYSWQSRHSDTLRHRIAGFRAQITQDEQIALQRERQSEAARKLLEESEAALLDLGNRMATASKLSTAAGRSASDGAASRWRDDVLFVRLSKEHLTTLSVQPLARDAANGSHLAAPAATLLGLTPDELSSVNEAIRILCEQYLALELARAPQIPKYQRTHEGIETVFAIPHLESEGAELKSAFTEALTSAIGQARTELILHYGRDTFWRQLAGFGQNAKTIELVARLDEQGHEQVKAYVQLNGPQNGSYTFKLPPDANDPNAILCRALWDRAQAAAK